jgi:hypothetical protein
VRHVHVIAQNALDFLQGIPAGDRAQIVVGPEIDAEGTQVVFKLAFVRVVVTVERGPAR